MKLEINLEYFTSPGESLCLVFSDGREHPMGYVAGGIWSASVDVPASARKLEYTFEVRRDGTCIRKEWEGHVLPLPSGKKPGILEVRDCWHDRPADSPFRTKAFTDVIFRKKATAGKRTGNMAFVVAASQVRTGEVLAITGSGPLFGNWQEFRPMNLEKVFMEVTQGA